MITLTRQQIARIVANDQAAVRAFEDFFRAINESLPNADLDYGLEAGTAGVAANSASEAALSAVNIAILAALAPCFEPASAGLSVDPSFAFAFGGISLADTAPATGVLVGD